VRVLSVTPRLLVPSRAALMSTAVPDNAFGIAEVAGDAATTAELRACRIGGCCGKDTPRLSAEAVEARLGALPEWTLHADGTLLRREFVAKNWAAAMKFFNELSALAEEEGHHPDIHLTGWRNVKVELTTHAIGGLSMPDFVLAAKLDAIDVEYSPKWLRERKAPPPPG
jgi:4a-hydroxytetrahydrobiopterin dehydratase